MTSILILNGPNLNMLGTRQPEIYGHETLDDIRLLSEKKAKSLSVHLSFEQSNSEGDLVDQIQNARGTFDGIILNAGAYTHTSVAIMDAISSAGVPTIELHLSNIHSREDYRQKSFVAKVAFGVICGFGAHGYALAIDAMTQHLTNPE